MKNFELHKAAELKLIERKLIVNINGIEFGELYPFLYISNKYVYYYDIDEQEYKIINAPFIVTTK